MTDLDRPSRSRAGDSDRGCGDPGPAEPRTTSPARLLASSRFRGLLTLVLVTGTLAAHALTRDGAAGPLPRYPSQAGATTPDFVLPEPVAAPAEPLPAGAEPAVLAALSPSPLLRFAATSPSPGSGPVDLEARLDRSSVLQGGDGRLHLELDLRAGDLPGEEAARVATDLFVVLDVSGSMAGEKIEQAKSAVVDLIAQLHDRDRFALVAFSSDSRVLVPPSPVTAEARSAWQRRVRSLDSGGGTDMVSAFDAAHGLLARRSSEDRACRVLLLSDGRPDTAEGLHIRASQLSSRGAALSALGIGHDFDEVLMSTLADAGRGNYYYLDRPEVLASVFTHELATGHRTLAKEVEITLRPAPGIRLIDAAGYPLEQNGDLVSFRPGFLTAGQHRRLWLTLELDSARPFEARPIGFLAMTYSTAQGSHAIHPTQDLEVACVEDESKFYAGIDGDAWGRAVANEQYGALQRQVSDLVRDGRQQEALDAIGRYTSTQERANRVVKNAEVDGVLEDAHRLREEVDEAFRGPDAEERRKMMAKEQHALSQMLRRLDAGKGDG
ncbi:MAG: VWA domain-containing protein [Holophagales bacterium]|nr:VWA domain-containing protein [Holophagales bacterium]